LPQEPWEGKTLGLAARTVLAVSSPPPSDTDEQDARSPVTQMVSDSTRIDPILSATAGGGIPTLSLDLLLGDGLLLLIRP
jgi:hypothetical protein